MKTLGIIAKVALSIVVVTHLGGSSSSFDLFGTITIFAAIYGLFTWYIFSFANGSPIFVGSGLISFAFAMILNLCLPLLVLVIPMFILQAILPGETIPRKRPSRPTKMSPPKIPRNRKAAILSLTRTVC